MHRIGCAVLALTTIIAGIAPASAQTYYAREVLKGLSRKATTPQDASDPDAAYRWDVSSWSDWSSTCSADATRTRTVSCVDSGGGPAPDAQCLKTGARPVVQDEPQRIVTDCSAELKNGSFENGLSNWSQSGSPLSIDSLKADGSASAFIRPNPGEISQIVATVPGATYTVTWMMAKNASISDNGHWRASVASGGSVVAQVRMSPSGTRAFQSYSMSWVANSSNATISFRVTTSGGSNDIYIDAVKLSAQ